MSFNLYLVRHGETYFNKYQRMQGWGNAPLTDKGISDGFAAGERLSNVRFDAAYSSDLQRAIHTAEFILGRNTQSGDLKTPEQLQQFREQFFGFFEGLPSASSAEQIAGIIGLENITSYGDLMSQLIQRMTLRMRPRSGPALRMVWTFCVKTHAMDKTFWSLPTEQ